jgi:sucrose phosphorylase
MKNEVQLITYVDRFGGGGLRELQALLTGPFHAVFGAVHLLPFFDPFDGADAGFDPIDHTNVDPRLGNWSDVAALSHHLGVMADVIVNHVSDRSPQFLDWCERGSASPYAGMFLTRASVYPQGASADDLARIYRPRPSPPFRDITLASGERHTLWTTFTAHQVDIDVLHPQGRDYLERILDRLASSGVSMVRLDAVGYAIKKAGTSCFMLPETFDFIAAFAARGRALGVEVLVEVHAYYRRQIEIAAHVDWVYDFALPPLVLHAFLFATAERLKEWLQIRPRNCITVLDTHDGIGIIDIGADPEDRSARPGLVPPAQIDQLVEKIHELSGGESRLATGTAASNLDLYQVNCTFLDALGRDECRYLLARAIQFFVPGIPQVYYVGLLAGHNDMALLARTKVGRDINRHYYTRAEIDENLRRPIVQDLLALIRFRNSHPAFGGDFQNVESRADELVLRWERETHFAELRVDLSASTGILTFSQMSGVSQLQILSEALVVAALPMRSD